MNFTSQQLIAGTVWNWTESPEGYPAPDFSLRLILKLGTGAAVEIDSTPDGSSHVFNLSAAESSRLASGEYHYQIMALQDDSTFLLDSGTKKIQALLSAAGMDPRGKWEKRLESLNAAYDTACTQGWSELTINGRTVVWNREQILKELEHAQAKFEQEKRIAAGKKANRTFLVRFS